MKRQTLNQDGGIISGFLSLILGIIVALIGFRILFDLFNVSQTSGIVSWVYSTSEPLIRPFYGIFDGTVAAASGGFNFAALIALVVYGVVGGIIASFISRSN